MMTTSSKLLRTYSKLCPTSTIDPPTRTPPTTSSTSHTRSNNNTPKKRKIGPLDAFITKSKSYSHRIIPPTPIKAPKAAIQTRLNYGQKFQLGEHCAECGMYYLSTNASDRALHQSFHDAFQKGIEFHRYKSEIELPLLPLHAGPKGTRFVRIDPASSSPALLAKLNQIAAHVDNALGASPTDLETTWLILAIHTDSHRVVGVLIVDRDPVSAWPVMTFPSDSCALPTTHNAVGVSRIWTHPKHYRNGIATHLLHLLCAQLFLDDKALIAFSQPTESGWLCAKSFIGCDRVLIYC